MHYAGTLVDLALKALGCTQKDLAKRLKVSPSQVSQWRQSPTAHLSVKMETKLKTLAKLPADLDSDDLEFAEWTGSLANAAKWRKVIHELAENAKFSAETLYSQETLNDELGGLCWSVLHTLEMMGVEIPRTCPAEFDAICDADEDDPDDDEITSEAVAANPLLALVQRIFGSLTGVEAFYAAYLAPLLNDEDIFEKAQADNIHPCLIELAAAKLDDVDETLAPKFREFKRRTFNNYGDWLVAVKEAAFRAGVPLRAELLELLFDDPDDLSETADDEFTGFNRGRLHPDIYMNELLVGMRTIHQVLPAILKKLEMNDFALDFNALRLPTRAVRVNAHGDEVPTP